MYMYMYVCMYVCMYVYIYIYIYMDTENRLRSLATFFPYPFCVCPSVMFLYLDIP